MNPAKSLSPPGSRVRGGSGLGARLCLIALLAAIFFSLMGIAVHAAAAYVELLPHWTPGEALHYRITHTRRTYAGNELTSEQTAPGDLRIDVLGSSANGYLVAWTAERPPRGADAARETTPSADRAKPTRLILRIGLRGSYEGVENWREIQADSKRRLARDAEAWKSDQRGETTVQKMREDSARFIATREQIESTFASEAHIFFMALGRRYPVGRSLPFAGTIPDPMGDEPVVPCHGRWLLKGISGNGIALVDWSQSVSTEALRRSLEASARMLAARLGRSTPSFQLRSLTIEHRAEFNVHIGSGWPQSVIHTQTVRNTTSSHDLKREDILQFTQLAD